jgi:hypothetical protein
MVHILLLYSLHKNLKITQFDVQGAFLHAPISKEVFIKTPKGVNCLTPYLKLTKSLYGLKQSPESWYKTLTGWLNSIGFTESNCNPCLYICDNKVSFVLFHIDNLVLVGPGNNFKEEFKTRFSNSSCHKPNIILGMKFEKEEGKIKMLLPKHIQQGLKELGLTDCKMSVTPTTPNLKLVEASIKDHARFKKLNINYRSAIGLLNHIAQLTRTNISFAISNLDLTLLATLSSQA